MVFAGGSDRIKIGLVGCGSRGVDAVRNCIAADPGVQLHAIGDLFADPVASALNRLTAPPPSPDPSRPRVPVKSDRLDVPAERRFVGFDAYQQVITSGIDIVLLATPPQFRPRELEAAIAAGVHVFAEKPVAVDPVGVRRVIQVAEMAARKQLAIVAGTQRRHSAVYLETMTRVRDGAIGNIIGAQCYFMTGGLWHRGRKPTWSDMEYQIRNWYYFTWLSGDHIVEQHLHNLDVMNWALGGPPAKALGMGGRQSRTDPKYGNIWDHFAVEFEYPNGVRLQSMCRQIENTSVRTSERLVGTRGVAVPGTGVITGEKGWQYTGTILGGRDGLDREHVDLIRSIREGKPINHGRRIAESTLTAILGRTSAYTGRELSYEWLMKASRQDLSPPVYEFGPGPAVDVAIPGATALS
jgi:predicted dehydrogenase